MKRSARGLIVFLLVLAMMCPMLSFAASAASDVQVEVASFEFDNVGTVTFEAFFRLYHSSFGDYTNDFLTPDTGKKKLDVTSTIIDEPGQADPTKTEINITIPKSTVLTFDAIADYEELFEVYDSASELIKPDGTTYTIKDESATIVLTSPDENSQDFLDYGFATNNLSITNINLNALSGSVTVAYDSNFKIYANGSSTPISKDTKFNNVSTTAGIKLKAELAGADYPYKFVGWYVDGNSTVYVSDKPEISFIPQSDDVTIHVKYISSSTKKDRNPFIVGNEDLGYRLFTTGNTASALGSWTNALNHAELLNDQTNDTVYIIPLKGVTIPYRTDPYVLPENTTLLVPFDEMHTCYTEETVIAKAGYHPLTTQDYKFIQMNLAEGVELNVSRGAAICVCAIPVAVDTVNSYSLNSTTGEYEYASQMLVYDPKSDTYVKPKTGQEDQAVKCVHNGPVYDYYGQLDINGASITLESGSDLYAWGFITGADGQIIAKKGSTVYEFFQIADFRGGTITQAMMSTNQFPFNQYFVQNIEGYITFQYGSIEKVFMSAYVLSSPYKFVTEFIGYEDPENGVDCGFFKLKRNYESDDPEDQGYLIRHYDKAHDKVYYDIYGNTAVASIKIKLDDPRGGYIDVDSKDYYMPITNINVTLESGANLFAESNYIFLPGSSLKIHEGAAMHIKDESDIVFADKNDVLNYSANGGTTTITPYKPCLYFPDANLERSWETTDDAELDNNGSIEVDNKSSLRTTSGGANIYSSNNTGVFTMGRSNNAKLDVYKSSSSSSQISINKTAFNVYDDEGNIIDTIDISGTWFGILTDDADDEVPEEETEQFSQFEDRCVYSYNEDYGWGNFCDVTYYSSAEDGAESLYSYANMNIADKRDNQIMCSNDARLEKEYSLNDENGVRAENNVYDDGWIYVPTYDAVAGEYLYTQVRAYPRYTKTIATHTITWYAENGTDVLATTSALYGESPESYMPAETEYQSGGRYYTFAGWTAETLDSNDQRTFNNGVFYARSDELPKIGSVPLNDPCYKAVYKQCFEKHSLTLAGDISTNFYVNVPASYEDKIDRLRVDFSWGKQYSGDNNGVYQYNNRPITSSDTLIAASGDLYKVTVDIAAKEMNDTITAKLVYTPSNTVLASENYSAADYLYNAIEYDDDALAAKVQSTNNQLTDEQALDKADALKDLCKATLAYGASAQIDFNYKTGSLVDYGLDAATEGHNADAIVGEAAQTAIKERFFEITDPDSDTSYESILWDLDFTDYDIRSYKEYFSNGVGSGGYYGSSLTLNNDINYNLYFRYKLTADELDGDPETPDVDFTVSAYTCVNDVCGTEHPVSRHIIQGDSYKFIRFDIENIAAADITKDIRVTFTRTDNSVSPITFDVNPGIYFYNVLCLEFDNDVTNNLKNVVCNLYNYNQKAIAYYG